MGQGMNQVNLLGNLGADPELRTAQSGTAVLKLRLATTERVKKNDAWEDHTEWHRCVVFGARATALHALLVKGSQVQITGRLRTSKYDKNGVDTYSTEINVDELILCGSAPQQQQRQAPQREAGDDSFDYGASAPQQRQAPPPRQPAPPRDGWPATATGSRPAREPARGEDW